MTHDPKTPHCQCGRKISRRGFITALGVGAAGVAASGAIAAQTARTEETPMIPAGEMVRIVLDVNDRQQTLLVEPRWMLLHVLRESLGMTATKVGCERGECGACTVLIDDIPRYACMTLAVEAQGHRITTLEGLMEGERLGPLQEAFLEEDAYQCGYCTPGQIMAAEGLLRSDADPSSDTITRSMSGNLCRCGTYPNIHNAIQRAAAKRR